MRSASYGGCVASVGRRLVVVERAVAQVDAAAEASGVACVYRKTNGSLVRRVIGEANAKLAPGFDAPRGFIF